MKTLPVFFRYGERGLILCGYRFVKLPVYQGRGAFLTVIFPILRVQDSKDGTCIRIPDIYPVEHITVIL